MADVYTSTYTDGYDKSLKPDVDEMIGLFAHEETPFLAGMSREKADAVKIEWLEDDLQDPAKNAHIEGADVVFDESNAPSRKENYQQIFSKNITITGTAKAVKMYGRTSDLNRQRQLRGKELSRDIEYAMLNGVMSAGTATTAREMKGAFNWVDTASGSKTHYNFGSAKANTNHITEDILLDVAQGIWDEGGKPNTVLAPMYQRRKISDFTDKGRLTINQNAGSKRLTMSVRVLETDMGTMTMLTGNSKCMKPDEDSANKGTFYDKVLVYDRSNFLRRPLRTLKEEKAGVTGDNEKRFMVTETSLQCRSTKAVGSIVNLTQVKVSA